MAEGSETPEEPPRASERDLLAERRARRAVDADPSHAPDALTRRAEAAEATVQALESHLSSLQQRVREAAEERAVLAERLAAEQTVVTECEQELRRVKQREYAEQQLRVETEDRRLHAERDGRVELERLTRRLGASEHHARELAERLESTQRELDEAEQEAAAEVDQLRSAAVLGNLRENDERELQLRLSELERRALEFGREIDSERHARERAERQLAEMRAGYQRMELLVAELRGVVGELRLATAQEPRAEPPNPAARARGQQREELADALAAAVERLRARAEALPQPSEEAAGTSPAGTSTAGNFPAGTSPAGTALDRLPTELEQPLAEPVHAPIEPAQERTPHKHSMSLLTRARLRRKQRRARRSTAAQPPNIHPQ